MTLVTETLELALAHFPRPLVAAHTAADIRGFADSLTGLRQLYFEFRLGGDDRRVDVSEHFGGAAESAEAVAELARRRAASLRGYQSEAWARIYAFARLWDADSALTKQIVEMGLEHDAGSSVPAIFIGLADSVLADHDAVRRFLKTVSPAADTACDRMLEALELAQRHGLVVSRMVGAMLSRDAQLRVAIRGLSPARTASFLEAAKWPGDLGLVVELLSSTGMGNDAARLVLGFAPDLLAECGIEMLCRDRTTTGSEDFIAWLRWLVDSGHADPGRVAALDEWQGALTPAEDKWPGALIARDIVDSWNSLHHFNRFVSHTKVNIARGAALPAKAYLALAPGAVPIEYRAHA